MWRAVARGPGPGCAAGVRLEQIMEAGWELPGSLEYPVPTPCRLT